MSGISDTADTGLLAEESSTRTTDYSHYLTLVHTDSFDKDESDGKETQHSGMENGDESKLIDEKENQTEEEKIQRAALIEELEKVEAEMKTLRSVLSSKQKRAAEIKKSLGFNIVNDVKEKVKHLQESDVVLKTNQAFKSAGERTSAAFSSFGKRFGDVKSKIGESIGTSINNVKARVNSGNRSEGASAQGDKPPTIKRENGKPTSLPVSTIADEDISLYNELDDSPY